MKKPRVSVVMITYNHESYIEVAINSILMQRCDFDVELIVSNDNSVDGTNEIIQKLLKQDYIPAHMQVHYHNHEHNKGMMSNFIWSLKQALGKYIALCEGDDYWTDPLKLQKQVDFLEKHPDFGTCAHNVQIVGEEFGNLVDRPYNANQQSSEISAEQLISGFRLPTNSIVFRSDLRSYLFKEPWMTKVRSGDKCLYLTLAGKAKVYYEHSVMAAYRKHPGGVVGSYDSWDYNKHMSIHQNQIFFWCKFKKYFYPKHQQAIKINIAQEFSQMAMRAIAQSNYISVMGYTLNTLRYDLQSFRELQEKLFPVVKRRFKEFRQQKYLSFRIVGSKIKQGLLGFLKFK